MIDNGDDVNSQGIEVKYNDSNAPFPPQMLQTAKSKRFSIESNNHLSTMSPEDISTVLSKSSSKPSFTSVNIYDYVVSLSSISVRKDLMDRRASGGISGNDSRVVATIDRKFSVSGIDNLSCGAVVSANRGEVVVMHQYARIIDDPTIHSAT